MAKCRYLLSVNRHGISRHGVHRSCCNASPSCPRNTHFEERSTTSTTLNGNTNALKPRSPQYVLRYRLLLRTVSIVPTFLCTLKQGQHVPQPCEGPHLRGSQLLCAPRSNRRREILISTIISQVGARNSRGGWVLANNTNKNHIGSKETTQAAPGLQWMESPVSENLLGSKVQPLSQAEK